jgi:hypothetical protein
MGVRSTAFLSMNRKISSDPSSNPAVIKWTIIVADNIRYPFAKK